MKAIIALMATYIQVLVCTIVSHKAERQSYRPADVQTEDQNEGKR